MDVSYGLFGWFRDRSPSAAISCNYIIYNIRALTSSMCSSDYLSVIIIIYLHELAKAEGDINNIVVRNIIQCERIISRQEISCNNGRFIPVIKDGINHCTGCGGGRLIYRIKAIETLPVLVHKLASASASAQGAYSCS